MCSPLGRATDYVPLPSIVLEINTTRSIVGVQVLKHTSYKAWKVRKKEEKEKLGKTQSYHHEGFAKFPVAQHKSIWDLYANHIA